MAGELLPHKGSLKIHVSPYYVPQLFGQYNGLTVAQALRNEWPQIGKMQFELINKNMMLHKGAVLFTAIGANHKYDQYHI